MQLLAAWSTSGWLPSGHALRMALDLGLHHVLEKLADAGAKRGVKRSSGIWSFRRAFGCDFIGLTISASASFTGCRGRAC